MSTNTAKRRKISQGGDGVEDENDGVAIIPSNTIDLGVEGDDDAYFAQSEGHMAEDDDVALI